MVKLKRPYGYWKDAKNILAEGGKYVSRGEFAINSPVAYREALARGMLEQLYPDRTRSDWSDDEQVLAEGRKYSGRYEFWKLNGSAYNAAKKRGLLDVLYSKKNKSWLEDEAVIAEAKKYSSKTRFRECAPGAYDVAKRRKLLSLIDWPEENATSDNDTIYIWRAVGQHYNGHPVYKIGVTSARLGDARIKLVSRKSGFKFDLICCEVVQCKATELERKLHLLGEDPQLSGFGGCTEFRALSDSALYAAISMICNQLQEEAQ